MPLENQNFFPKNKFKVGGSDYAPPTFRLRPAHISACVAVYAEATGSARKGAICLPDSWTRVC